MVLFTLLLTACGDPEPQLKSIPSDGVILAFGDSLTEGVGAGKGESYPDHLRQLSGRKVINAGVRGELSAQGLQRLPALLDEIQPNLLILCHGGNDILRRKPKEQARANLRAMVLEAQTRGVDVVLIGVPEFSLLSLESAPYYEELAQEMGLVYEGGIVPALESDRSVKVDRVHFSGEGYRRMAEAIHNLLKERGAF
jgi:lysophospholipase L1-like esterase